MKKKILLFILLSNILIEGFKYYKYLFKPNVIKAGYLKINKEDTYEKILENISEFLKNKETFNWVATKKKYPNNIKKGKYFIKKGTNNLKLVNKLRAGDQNEVKVQFGAENTFDEFILKVSSQLEMSAKSLEEVILNPKFLKKNKVTKANVHQLFLPNTYHTYWTISPEDLLKIFNKEYDKYWNKERRKKAKELNLNLLEVTTLASIVQKETSKVDEMPKIAGLYLNRLKANWKLQSCPTVIHAIRLSNKKRKKIGRLFYKDLKIISKYNTYIYKGLPPAPICLPEIPSIEAVLNPMSHDYYYMVVSPEKKGYHEFSKTALEHQKKRISYLNWLGKNKLSKKFN